MKTIFYILVFLSVNTVTLDTDTSYQPNISTRVEVVDSLDGIIKDKELIQRQLRKHGIAYLLPPPEADKIYKVTIKNGKVVSTKEVRIVPVTKTKKVMKEEQEIVGYEVKE